MPSFDFIRATKKATLDSLALLVSNDDLIIEEKFDGSRFGAEIFEGQVRMISRNGIDRAINVPYIVKELLAMFPSGTILDGEIIHLHEPHAVRWELARSVMGTNDYTPGLAEAHYVIYDIQMLGGESYKNLEYKLRRNTLKEFFPDGEILPTTIVKSRLAMPRAWKVSKHQELWDYVVTENGGEGIMIKNLKETEYAKSWTKAKKAFTIDAFVIGIEKGKGKYEGQVGSLIIALYDHNKNIQEIGKCSGMTDAQRQDFTDRAIAGTLKGMVCEVSANELTKNLKLRHPQFVRERDDKPADQCTISTLVEIASNN